MNYLEIGLPHINLAPKLTTSPRPLLPVSGLSRKYLGIEEMTKKDIDTLVNRLSRPKTPRQEDNNEEQTHQNSQRENINPDNNGKKMRKTRFGGSKKMSARDIGNMVDRLSRTKTKEDKHSDTKSVRPSTLRQNRSLFHSYAWQGHDHHLHKPVFTSPSYVLVK